MHDIPHKNDMGSQRHSQQNSGTGHTAWLHQLPWAEMQGHGTGQSSIVKCNLTSRSLLVHHLAGLRRICKGSECCVQDRAFAGTEYEKPCHRGSSSGSFAF